MFNSNTSTIMLINIADDLDHEKEVSDTLNEISNIRIPLTKAKRNKENFKSMEYSEFQKGFFAVE